MDSPQKVYFFFHFKIKPRTYGGLKQELEEKLESERADIKGEYRPPAWGTQIRSYVLHPYKMVKDLRTEVETSDTEGVLDGDLDEFLEAQLMTMEKPKS